MAMSFKNEQDQQFELPQNVTIKIKEQCQSFFQPFLHYLSSTTAQMQKMGQKCSQNQSEKDEEYFLQFFSPKETAESIRRRNQNLEMISFENCHEEPDDIYNRRKNKVNILLSKEKQLLKCLHEIKNTNLGQYMAIIQFVRFFCSIKEKIRKIKTDYYSNKTFCAIKNCSEQDLQNATCTLKQMFNNIISHEKCNFEKLDEIMLEFLIIPRFLISREKINKLIHDEELQKTFQFLIVNQSLGHYNNEANKKFPEKRQMNLVKELLGKHNGREKFKKICSINHGNKFLIKYPMDYYQLYYKSLEYLKFLDCSFKKGKKYEAIRKDLQKNPVKTTEESVTNSKSLLSDSDSHSTQNIFSFNHLNKVLNRMDLEQESRQQVSPLQISPKKKTLKRLNTLPEKQESVSPVPRFRVKKHVSETVSPNIILIQPPQNI